MKALIIACRDVKALLTSPLFLLIAAFCASIWSVTFIRSVFAFAEESVVAQQMGMGSGGNIHTQIIQSHLSWVFIILIFTVPAITMKILTEEKKLHTFDLLLTLPITSTDIVIGKFFAGFFAVLVLIVIALIFPLGLSTIAEVAYGPLLTSFLGLILMAAVYTSVGIFCAALTQSLILSVIMGLIANLSLFLLNGLDSNVENPIVSEILRNLEVAAHFGQFIRGVISTQSIVFLLSVVVFFIFLAQRVIESMRWR